MGTIKPYPHYEINVKDNSIYNPDTSEILPVHRPLYVMKAQKGPVGIPTWCADYKTAVNTFGEQTFNQYNKISSSGTGKANTYFSEQAAFLNATLPYNGAFICRVVHENARASILILEAKMHLGEVQQYVTNTDGSYVYDDTIEITSANIGGDFRKKKTGTGATENGWIIEYRVRTLAPGEVSQIKSPYGTNENGKELTDWLENELKASETTEGSTTYYTYPLLAFIASNKGLYGDDLAFSLYYNYKNNTKQSVLNMNSVYYTFGCAVRDYQSTTVSSYMDKYNRDCVSFTANPDAVDVDTNIGQDMTTQLSKAFSDNPLPYSIYTYEKNFNEIGNKILSCECGYLTGTKSEKQTSFEQIFTFSIPDGLIDDAGTISTALWLGSYGYRINAISARSVDNNREFPHVFIKKDGSATKQGSDKYVYIVTPCSLIQKNYMFLQWGMDGELSDDIVETAMKEMCRHVKSTEGEGVTYEIIDKFRFPFTHIYDVGFSFSTKKAMIEFLDIRDDIVVELSTQVLRDDGTTATTFALNTQEQDEDKGTVLRDLALLQKESLLYGTECCRCSIYCHAGFLANSDLNWPLPFTYWSAIQHAKYGRNTYMSVQEPRGWPYSYNELFDVSSLTWTNYDNAGQERVFDEGLNYVQYADMKRIFYPCLRTVYNAATSVLTDQWFVDAVVYTKHIVRQAWGSHTGRNDKAAVIQKSLNDYLTTKLTALYNGKYDFVVSVYQTDEEVKLGYVTHVKISITAPATLRVLDVDIECNREGYTPEE